MKHTTDDLTNQTNREHTVVALADAVKIIRQRQEILQLRSNAKEPHGVEHLVGISPAMAQLRDVINRAASSDATVLISGETGTGKELVASALHYESRRAKKPFIEVNCAALTETLVESELFGHERGAFTSAISRHRGKFEQADGGSLFLDEIGDMPVATQAKMLRVLQERSFARVGGHEKLSVDVRIICATNHNLEEAVGKGNFRLDLLYRIGIIVIDVPPLRERKADIPKLARYFLSRCRRDSVQHPAQDISDTAIEALCLHNWPGNVRELQNAIERASVLCKDDVIEPSHLPPTMRASPQPQRDRTGETLIRAVQQLERSMIRATLEECGWVKSHAARMLGVTGRMLSYKMQNLGIERTRLEN